MNFLNFRKFSGKDLEYPVFDFIFAVLSFQLTRFINLILATWDRLKSKVKY